MDKTTVIKDSVNEFKQKIQEIEKSFISHLNALNPKSADPDIVGNLIVDIGTNKCKINTLASLATTQRTIHLNVFNSENKEKIKACLQRSNFPNISTVGNIISVVLPSITTDYLKQIVDGQKEGLQTKLKQLDGIRTEILKKAKVICGKDDETFNPLKKQMDNITKDTKESFESIFKKWSTKILN